MSNHFGLHQFMYLLQMLRCMDFIIFSESVKYKSYSSTDWIQEKLNRSCFHFIQLGIIRWFEGLHGVWLSWLHWHYWFYRYSPYYTVIRNDSFLLWNCQCKLKYSVVQNLLERTFQSSNRVRYYLERPHVTKLDEISGGILNFPAVTICNLNEFRFNQITRNDM